MSPSARRWRVRARRWGLVVLLVAAAALPRLALLDRQGLWTDEYFSLATATGHGLEHPAAAARPEQGDFVEHPGPRPLRDYARALEPAPGTTPDRIVEAVRRSDTNPPLYYLALAGWLRLAGPGDLALRLFSALAALAAVPVLAWTARRAAGRRAVVPACLAYAGLPASLYYGTEGRMYGAVLLLAAATVALTLRAHRRGLRPGGAAALVLVVASGLLTHHFFLFVAAAVGGWLLVEPGRARRAHVVAALAGVAVLVAPWYLQLPALAGGWRVTAGWLEVRPAHHDPVRTPLWLAWSLLAARGPWGGRAVYDLLVALPAAMALLAALRARTPAARLLVVAAAAPPLGVAVFDHLLGTYAAFHTRYALAALPALALLLGAGLARAPRPAGLLLLAALLLGCAGGARRVLLSEARCDQPYREVGRLVAREAAEGDLLLVHSIPSGVTGLAREVERAGGAGVEPPLLAWVGQLGARREADLPRLVAGFRRVLLVEVHTVGDPAVPRAWLEANARRVSTLRRGAAQLSVFELAAPGRR